tara:strand:+ start:850 stop:1152 length:303 start_codon:yes stop_codon:yes gene_type:complete
MAITSEISNTTKTFGALLTLGLTGLLFLIVFGNLSGNLGFATDSQGANDTSAVITNLTGGTTTFFGFANVWFTLLAVVLLIIIVMSVIGVVQKRQGGGGY